jgi:hypothetical protein
MSEAGDLHNYRASFETRPAAAPQDEVDRQWHR